LKTPHRKSITTETCYDANEAVKNTMQNYLRFQQLAKSTTDKIMRGAQLTKEEKEHEKNGFEELRGLEKNKTDMLTRNIFPSMANLVLFFEYANKPELREIFDKDIQVLLFGTRQEIKSEYLYEFFMEKTNVIRRLINALLLLLKDTELTDFRFLLLNIILTEIYDMLARDVQFGCLLNEPIMVQNLILKDIGRGSATTQLLSNVARTYSKQQKFNPNSRPVLF
jgi:hypothetical protein